MYAASGEHNLDRCTKCGCIMRGEEVLYTPRPEAPETHEEDDEWDYEGRRKERYKNIWKAFMYGSPMLNAVSPIPKETKVETCHLCGASVKYKTMETFFKKKGIKERITKGFECGTVVSKGYKNTGTFVGKGCIKVAAE